MDRQAALREAADNFARRLRHEFPEGVERMFLYGSVAHGDPGPKSDVDLIVIAKDKRDIERTLPRLVGESMRRTGHLLQVFVVDEAEYEAMNRRESAFAHALRDEGVALEG